MPEMALGEKNDQSLRAAADEAFARRGSLARYLTRHGQIDDVVKVGREIAARFAATRN